MTVLDRINSPQDLKKLTLEEMNLLASDIRDGILTRVNALGGHLGPDLGIVEMTIALHYVFNSPVDKFVFDVSHQVYPHKMLTGRKRGFLNPRENFDITGYSNPRESEHDNFIIGHTSTSVSLATGLAKARDLKGESYNIVAIIGDGSLSGGQAYEGFNNAAMLDSNMIVIINDNEMSIAENQGGLYKNLAELRNSKGQTVNNFFKTLGFEYMYVEEGNDIEKMISAFEKVKDSNAPIVVNVRTLKGKGYAPAEQNKEVYHWLAPGFLDKKEGASVVNENYYTVTNDFILRKQAEDKTVIAISAATPGAYGFVKDFRDKLGTNYTDVGIAEEHAIAYASALATNGAKPILAIMSSFVQRTYDQLSQDLALNNSPATILVHWGGITAADATHLCVFDIPLISNIPNMVYLSPTCKEEYLAMLEWSLNQTEHPVAIRVPTGNLISTGVNDKTDYSKLNKFEMVKKGSKIAVIGAGNFFHLAKEVVAEIKAKMNIDATLINPKFLTGIDEELLNNLKEEHSIVITLEDGVLDGGYSEKISRFYASSNMKVLNYGAKKEFTDRVPLSILYERYRLKKELILEDVSKLIEVVV